MRIVLILLCLAPTLLFGQISAPLQGGKKTTIGKIAPAGGFLAELFYLVHPEGDTVYHLMYKDMRFPSQFSLETISFRNIDNTLGIFYDYLHSTVTNSENKYTQVFMLGGQKISLMKTKNMGIPEVMMMAQNGSVHKFTRKELDKLFAK